MNLLLTSAACIKTGIPRSPRSQQSSNLIEELRNSIVGKVVEANQRGAFCGVPDSFEITLHEEIAPGVKFTVPIVLSDSERELLNFSQHPYRLMPAAEAWLS